MQHLQGESSDNVSASGVLHRAESMPFFFFCFKVTTATQLNILLRSSYSLLAKCISYRQECSAAQCLNHKWYVHSTHLQNQRTRSLAPMIAQHMRAVRIISEALTYLRCLACTGS
jgi:hypothetical protein